MTDRECLELLQWAAPRLGLRWRGFRRVRGQVCKRIDRRLKALGLDAASYRALLERDAAELQLLDGLCRVTISRFYRDRAVWDALRASLLPTLAASLDPPVLRAWSAGCASGEEPYTLALVHRLALVPRLPALELELTATDADPRLLRRAEAGCYADATLRELPEGWKQAGFTREESAWCVRPELRRPLRFECADVRTTAPGGPLHLLLCRNLVFTYFDEAVQQQALERFQALLSPGGLLVIGAHERLPPTPRFVSAAGPLPIFRAAPPPPP